MTPSFNVDEIIVSIPGGVSRKTVYSYLRRLEVHGIVAGIGKRRYRLKRDPGSAFPDICDRCETSIKTEECNEPPPKQKSGDVRLCIFTKMLEMKIFSSVSLLAELQKENAHGAYSKSGIKSLLADCLRHGLLIKDGFEEGIILQNNKRIALYRFIVPPPPTTALKACPRCGKPLYRDCGGK